MTNFKKYLYYRFKKSFLRTAAFAVMALVLTYYWVTPTLLRYRDAEGGTYFGQGYYSGELSYAGYLDLSAASAVLIVAAAVIAVMETSDFKNKRNLDTFYSLPLSRRGLALAHYLSGALQTALIFTVSVICSFIMALPYASYMKLWLLPAYYLLSLIFGLGFYSFVIFLFGEANTVLDGIIFCGMWGIFGSLLLYNLTVVTAPFAPYMTHTFWSNLHNVGDYWGMAYLPLGNLANLFTDMVSKTKAFESTSTIISRTFAMFFVWAGIYIACAVGYFRTFCRKGAENAGEISSSAFGYKLLIPLYGLNLLIDNSDFDILLVIYFALMIVGYVIYRRGFKFKKGDIAVLICTACSYFLLAGVLQMSDDVLLAIGSVLFFIVSLCRLLGALKENKEKPGYHEKSKVAMLAVLFALSVLMLAYIGTACAADIIHYRDTVTVY